MIYVMGLEAAKTRPADEVERVELRRLMHEGMDAGLCGFSIQRLGSNSAQGDYDGTPMVTDIMVDDDILIWPMSYANVMRDFARSPKSPPTVKETGPSWSASPPKRSARSSII